MDFTTGLAMLTDFITQNEVNDGIGRIFRFENSNEMELWLGISSEISSHN